MLLLCILIDAKELRKLIPVKIDDVEPPFGFGLIQSIDLFGWDGKANHPALQQLIKVITKLSVTNPKREGKMKVTIGTFNLNNLFSRFNFKGAITKLQSGTSSAVTLRYEFTDPENKM